MSRGAIYSDPFYGRVRREIVSPEGVPLVFYVARSGARMLAFFVDFLLIVFVSLLLIFGLSAGAALGASEPAAVASAFGILAWFALVNFYFPLCELRWQGATLGKWLVKIRVIDRHGGPLTAQAIFARNFMRDLELWVPLKVLVAYQLLYTDVPEWTLPLMVLWAIGLMIVPLLNADRLRLGDIVGGTMVVEAPRATLLADLAGEESRTERKISKDAYHFTPEQLDIYGNYELHVLEDLLRQGRRADRRALRLVCEKIVARIGWDEARQGKVEDRRFLHDFYAAQRARLEQKMLLGRKQERKRGGGEHPPGQA